METPTRTLFDPQTPFLDTLQREWVQLDEGWVCVREMQFADTLFCNEHSQRGQPGESGFGMDVGALQVWQIVCSCYRGDEPTAARTFGITDRERIKKLKAADSRKLLEAINRVNGWADSEVAAADDFTAAGEALSTATPSSGVSRTSIASPVS